MNTYQTYIGRIQYGLFFIVVALLPYPQIFLRYACITWWVLWLLEGRWLKKPVFSSSLIPMQIPLLLFGAWYVWRIISGLWATDLSAWSSQLERYLSFGLLIPIGLWGVNEQYNWQQIGKVLVISCIAAVPFYLVLFTALYYHPELVRALQWENMLNDQTSWYLFFAENISALKHRLYLCAVELFGAGVAYLLYRHRPWILFPSIAVMLSMIPLTTSRQSIITAIAMIVAALIYALPKKYRTWYGAAIIGLGVIIGGGLLALHPRMEGFNYNAVTEMREVSYLHDQRLNIWGAALQHQEDYLLPGLGAGQSIRYLQLRFEELNLPYYAEKGYNCHNQYPEEVMELGIFGLILFLTAWLFIPLCTKGQRRQAAWLFILLFLFNMTTECFFGRYDGVALWSAGMIFLLSFGFESHAQGKE